MNAKAIVFISCRLLAIYLMATHIVPFVFQLVSGLFLQPGIMQDPSFLPAIGATAFGIALYGLIALFLWNAAGWLSRSISAPFPDAFGEDIDFHRWQAVIVMTLGGMALLRAAAFGGEILRASTESMEFMVRGAVVFTGVGIGMIVFSRQIVIGLGLAREWLGKPFVKVEDDQ